MLKERILAEADMERIERDATEEMEEAERLASEDPTPADPQTVLRRALYAD